MKRKTRKRLAKEAALARAEARGDFSHLKDKKGNLKSEPLDRPTLPNVGFVFDDEKHGQFYGYPPNRGALYPPPPMSEFGGSDFYQLQHRYTPSIASNDAGWGPPPFASQSAASLVPLASKGSGIGVGHLFTASGTYAPPSYHSDHDSLSQTRASRSSPSPSPDQARNAAIYDALELPHASDDPQNGASTGGYLSPVKTEAMGPVPCESPSSDYSSYDQGVTPYPTYDGGQAGHHGVIGESAYMGADGDVADFYDAYGRASVYQRVPEQPRASVYEPPSRARLLERTRQGDDDDV
jgi:hypothetical protein